MSISHTNFKNVALSTIAQQPSHHFFYPAKLRYTQDTQKLRPQDTPKLCKPSPPPVIQPTYKTTSNTKVTPLSYLLNSPIPETSYHHPKYKDLYYSHPTLRTNISNQTSKKQHSSTSIDPLKWIVDSGANKHMS